VFVSAGERDAYLRRGVARWFRTDADHVDPEREPFEPVAQWPGQYRIRSRADGSCGFLSPENRCRLHEQLGAAGKPLTCRMFPFTFHPSPGGVVVTASFGCPTIVENRGEPVAEGRGLQTLEVLRGEWSASAGAAPARRTLVAGRSIDGASTRILRESLLAMLGRTEGGVLDLRANVRRIAHALDDLTRSRVLGLADHDFAEYVKLTLPYAAAQAAPPARRPVGRIGRLMQRGFLYLVTATRLAIEHRHLSPFALRLARLRLLAHFHGLWPATGGVNVRALATGRVDVNDPALQPLIYHYLRAGLEALGARRRPLLDDLAITVACLNAACALAVMRAAEGGRLVDHHILAAAIMDSVDLVQADERSFAGRVLPRFAAGVEALGMLGR
jgi:Fe-S-cluster containining protein